MAKLVYHVDDSKIAQRLVQDAIRIAEPSLELKLFQSAKDMISTLEGLDPDAGHFPDAIFTDQAMPEMDGMELLCWIKSHPTFHQIPVVMLTAESQEHRRQKAISLGAALYIEKPIQYDAVKRTLEVVQQKNAQPKISREVELHFTEEAMDRVQQSLSLMPDLNEQSFQNLKRQLHTIKGGAYSVQYPVVGELVHEIERVLLTIEQRELYGHPRAKELIMATLVHIQEHLFSIRERTHPPMVPQSLKKMVETFDEWIEEGGVDSSLPVAAPALVKNANAPSIFNDGISTRIQNTQLNTLQDHVKKVIQVRTRLSTFSRALSQEFPDESFPKDLDKILDDLKNHSLFLLDFFISLRTSSVKRLVQYTTEIVTEVSGKLGKTIEVNCVFDEHDTMDTEIMSRIEMGIMHMVRNAIDHGFEGRSTGNQINLEIKPTGEDHYEIIFRDNGNGIDSDKLLESVIKKGKATEVTLREWPREKILDLIFLDGITTKDKVTHFSGRGVGLGAVRTEIKEVGGNIQVRSHKQKGTEFCIEVPRFFKV